MVAVGILVQVMMYADVCVDMFTVITYIVDESAPNCPSSLLSFISDSDDGT